MTYQDKIKVGIGRTQLQVNVDNSFPIAGDTVSLMTKTKWAQQMQFDAVKAIGVAETIIKDNSSQQEMININITGGGDLVQTVTARNKSYSTVVNQLIMAMDRQILPYFDVAVAEICRVGETSRISVRSENGYLLTREHAIVARIYREDTEVNPVKILNFSSTTDEDFCEFVFISVSDRGIYDVEVDLTDIETGVTITKRINKLITVTPRLAARPTASQIANNEYAEIVADAKHGAVLKMYSTGENDLYCVFELVEGQTDNDSGYYTNLDISKIPSGKSAYTVILKSNSNKGKYYSRVLLTGSTDVSQSNANGTPQFSYEIPLVFTVDQDTPLTIWGVFYSAVNYAGCIRNTVWDGRGYYNLFKGIKFDRFSDDLFWEDAFMLLNGTSDVELFEIEISNCGFTAVTSKTDPTAANPQFWYGNFEEKNFVWHHSYIHDTSGEGCYLGYFTGGAKKNVVYTGKTTSFKNLVGETVTYTNGYQYTQRAHSMERLRLYRNKFERLGYDGIQISNARQSSVCYNIIDGGAIRNDADQSSGASLQSMDGKIYNNIIISYNGPGMQLGPLTDLEVFNNIVNTDSATDAIQFLFETENPDQNPTDGPTGVINDTTVTKIHNNVLVSGGITANGRNTVQMRKIYFIDNLMVNNGINFSNMTEETIQVWNNNMRGNAVYTLDDFKHKLQELKIADRNNSDFMIGNNSALVSMGVGLYFKFDFRGYKNWFPNIYPAGAYMGKYLNPEIEVVNLLLRGIAINKGAISTNLPDLSIVLDYVGIAMEYRIGLEPSLSDGAWKPLTSTSINYTLNNEYGERRVYVQIRNMTEISAISSSVINFVYAPTILMGVKINNAEESTIFDKVAIEMTYMLATPDQYMISESNLFEGAQWQTFTPIADYVIDGVSRDVVVYVKVKTGDIESEIKSASIRYTSTIVYKDIKIEIPVSEIGANVQVTFPNLKYDKKFAYSWTTDDSLASVYSRMFNYINKKWVDDSEVYHDGMPHTTGMIPSKYLCFTDGCGRDVRFGLNSGFISHLNGKTPTLEYDYSGSQYFHLKEMRKFIDFGNGLQNHGAGGYNDQGPNEAIRICNEEANNKLGFTPFLLLLPGEVDQKIWTDAGKEIGDVYQLTGAKNESCALDLLTDSLFKDKQNFMHRYTYDTFTLELLKEKIAFAFNQNNAHLMNFGGHNIVTNDSKFIDWNITVKPFLEYLYTTYGKGGNDSVWFAPLAEIYEYLFVRHFSRITTSIDGTNVVISIKIAQMKNFRQGDFSLKLSGGNMDGVSTIEADKSLYYLGKNLQADGSLLINISDNASLATLAEKYVHIFETTPSNDTMEDAEYMISRLSPHLKIPYQHRIDALNVPFSLADITINNGNATTTKREVSIQVIYTGFTVPLKYRLGETSNLTDIEWSDFAEPINHTLTETLGNKTIYCQIKSQNGEESEIKSNTVILVLVGSRKSIVSLGYNQAEIPNTTVGYSVFDSVTGITKFQSQTAIANARRIYDIEGVSIGTATPSSVISSMITPTNYKGAITGDNSGVFPDVYLEHNSVYGNSAKNGVNITFSIPAGSYKIRILQNTINKNTIKEGAIYYKAVTDTDDVPILIPASGIIDNIHNLSTPVTVAVGVSGMLKIEWGVSGIDSSWYYAPLNIIEIEEVK